MARAAHAVLPEPDQPAYGVELTGSELLQLRQVMRKLLAQRAGEPADQWRQSMLRSLRKLTRSDHAILVVRTAAGSVAYGDEVSPDLLSSYVKRFADLDRSRVAAREHGLEVWSLAQLWSSGELERSKYHKAFALPNRLHDTVGMTLHLASPRAEICLVFHRNWPGPPASVDHRRDLLAMLLEAIRAGFGLDLGRCRSGTSPVLGD